MRPIGPEGHIGRKYFFVTFGLAGMLFHLVMLLHVMVIHPAIYLQAREDSYLWGTGVGFYFLSLLTHWLPGDNFDQHRKALYLSFGRLRNYRIFCYRMARKRGISPWQWYIVPWLGGLCLAASTGLQWWLDPIRGISFLGIVAWALAMKVQTWRESRLDPAMNAQIDPHFVNRRLREIVFLSLGVTVAFYLQIDVWGVPPRVWKLSTAVFMIVGTFSIFPSLFHLLLGQRTAGISRPFSLINAYGYLGHAAPKEVGRSTYALFAASVLTVICLIVYLFQPS